MPNSMTQLNNFSNEPISFEDERPYAITFSANAAANTSTSIAEDQTFVVPTGINIASIRSQPGNITYTVSATGIGNVVGSWPNPLPEGVSNTSSGNVFSITGTFNADTWNAAKNLSLNVPDREANFSLAANLSYPNVSNVSANSSWTWTNNVIVTSTNQDWTNITLPRTYIQNNYNYLFSGNVPAISDDSGNTYVVTMTTSSNIGMITLSNDLVSPGDWSYANSTFTFSGNRSQVNNMLGNVRFISNLNATGNANVQLTSTTDPDDQFNATFALNYQIAQRLVKPELDIVYNEDQTAPVVDGANIATVQTTTHWSQPWSVMITQQYDDVPVGNLAKLGGSGWSSISGVVPGYPQSIYKTASSVTTVSDLLARSNVFNTVTVDAAPDAAVDYVLKVETGPDLNGFGEWQQIPEVFIRGVFIGETHAEFNFPTTGSYTENTLVAMPNPLITDLDPTVSTDPAFSAFKSYITQTSGASGAFFVNGSQTGSPGTLVITSSPPGVQMANVKSNINAYNIEFMPAVNSSEPVTFSYQQYKSNALSGNIAQANVVSTYTGTPVVHIINMTDRTFVDQQTNAIFANSTPQITDGSDRSQTYTITLSSTAGRFGNSLANALASSSYTFTGTRSQCNTEFSNMVFVPDVTESGLPTNNTFTYTQTRSGTVQVNQVLNLVKSGTAPISPIDQVFNSTSTFTFTESQALYGKITLVTVGGGGGGGCCGSGNQGGGGGGGEVTIGNATRTGGTYVIVPGTANLVVGSGGAVGTAGANSYVISNAVTLFNSPGGQGGNTTHGGNSGGGGTGGLPSARASGGGAGRSAPQAGDVNASTFYGGDGESGANVSIGTAFDGYYGGGGGGGYNAAAGGLGFGDGSRRFNRGGGGYGNSDPGLANSGGGGGAGAAGGSGRIILKIR